ncbi:MAG: hypothetical protein FWG61_06590 [Firmicutes bacterium]|nr:hypothetical protein [Bacillota bacterium]
MRYLYICPRHAIKARLLYRFIAFDSWYENEELNNLYEGSIPTTTPPPQ